jgi:hypothetical protein
LNSSTYALPQQQRHFNISGFSFQLSTSIAATTITQHQRQAHSASATGDAIVSASSTPVRQQQFVKFRPRRHERHQQRRQYLRHRPRWRPTKQHQFHFSLQQLPTPAPAAQLQLNFKISLSAALASSASSPLRNISAVNIEQQHTFQRYFQRQQTSQPHPASASALASLVSDLAISRNGRRRDRRSRSCSLLATFA